MGALRRCGVRRRIEPGASPGGDAYLGPGPRRGARAGPAPGPSGRGSGARRTASRRAALVGANGGGPGVTPRSHVGTRHDTARPRDCAVAPPPLAPLVANAGARLSGLRLADGRLILKIENRSEAAQVRLRPGPVHAGLESGVATRLVLTLAFGSGRARSKRLQRCFSPRPRPPNGSASRLARPSNIAGRARRPPPEARYPRMSATTVRPFSARTCNRAGARARRSGRGIRRRGRVPTRVRQHPGSAPPASNASATRWPGVTPRSHVGAELARRRDADSQDRKPFGSRRRLACSARRHGSARAGRRTRIERCRAQARHADEVAQLLRRVRFDVDHPQSPAGISATTRRWGAAQSSGPQCRARARSAVAKRSAYRAVISRRWR